MGNQVNALSLFWSITMKNHYIFFFWTTLLVDYLPLVPARRFLLPSLVSDSGAQSMWYPLCSLSLESRVQEVPNLSGVFGWWNYSKRHSVYITIAMYPWMCFCIIMRLNFCVGAKFRNGTYKNQCRNCGVAHCKSKPPVSGPKHELCL